MKKLLKRLSKRIYVKWLIWYRNNLTPNEKKISQTEKICLSITRKMITHIDSKFLIAPLSGKKYIKNPSLGLFVILHERSLSITNHVYHYDVHVDERNWNRLLFMYDNKTESIRQEYEDEIMSQIEHSLHKLQDKINNLSKISF